MSWSHYFEEDDAIKYGVNAAIMLSEVRQWIRKNEIEGRNLVEGKTWTFNSVKEWHKLVPFLSDKEIRSALDKLRAEGALVTGCFNKRKGDRTLWYALPDQLPAGANTNCPQGQTPIAPQGTPLPSSPPSSPPTPLAADQPQPNARRHSDHFYRKYAQHRNGAKPRFGVVEAKLLREDADRVGPDRLDRLINIFFDDPPLPVKKFTAEAGLEVRVFHSQLDKLLEKDAALSGQGSPPGVVTLRDLMAGVRP